MSSVTLATQANTTPVVKTSRFEFLTTSKVWNLPFASTAKKIAMFIPELVGKVCKYVANAMHNFINGVQAKLFTSHKEVKVAAPVAEIRSEIVYSDAVEFKDTIDEGLPIVEKPRKSWLTVSNAIIAVSTLSIFGLVYLAVKHHKIGHFATKPAIAVKPIVIAPKLEVLGKASGKV